MIVINPITYMQIACKIYFFNIREGRANEIVDRGGSFQKLQ
jgi:hypothetical protein